MAKIYSFAQQCVKCDPAANKDRREITLLTFPKTKSGHHMKSRRALSGEGGTQAAVRRTLAAAYYGGADQF